MKTPDKFEVINELAPNPAEIRRFVRTQLTSYAQRRQITVEVLAIMRDKLGDQQFALARAEITEPLADRLVRFERTFAAYVAQHLSINSADMYKNLVGIKSTKSLFFHR